MSDPTEAVPAPVSSPASAASGTSGFSITRDEQTWAMVAHGLTFVEGGIIGPLILYVVKRDESSFVAFHALQSFYFGAIFLVISILSCGLLALPAVIPYLIYEVIAAVRANEGQWYELPFAGRMALRKHHP